MQRFNIRLTPELHEHYKARSEKVGIPMSSLILMDLEKLDEQRQAQNNMSLIEAMLKAVEREAKEELTKMTKV